MIEKILSAVAEHKAKLAGPHFIFSAENPSHPDEQKIQVGHDEILKNLRGAGYDAHTIIRHQGTPDRAIIVYGTTPEQNQELHDLASRLGQDSSVSSTGSEHTLRYHHGDLAGQEDIGTGTRLHESKPANGFFSLPGGTHFTPNLDVDKAEEICLPKDEFVHEHEKLVQILTEGKERDREKEAKDQAKELLDITKSDPEDLEKGALKNIATAMGVAGALATASPAQAAPKAAKPVAAPTHQSTKPESRSVGTIGLKAPAAVGHRAPKSSYSTDRMLGAISQVETSGGKNISHKPVPGEMHGGDHAYGEFGLMPHTIRETISLNRDLKSKHKKAVSLQGEDLSNYMRDNPGLEREIAHRHVKRLEHHFGRDPASIYFSWLNGIAGTYGAKKKGLNLGDNKYAKRAVKAFMRKK